jgi:hypothetical protein
LTQSRDFIKPKFCLIEQAGNKLGLDERI